MMFSECQSGGSAHLEHNEPNWRAFAAVVDKENVNPAGHDAPRLTWPDTLAHDALTSATDAASEYPNSSRKTPGSRRAAAGKLARKPLRNITPLFERKVGVNDLRNCQWAR